MNSDKDILRQLEELEEEEALFLPSDNDFYYSECDDSDKDKNYDPDVESDETFSSSPIRKKRSLSQVPSTSGSHTNRSLAQNDLNQSTYTRTFHKF